MDRKEDRKSLHEVDEEAACSSKSSEDSANETTESSGEEDVYCEQYQEACEGLDNNRIDTEPIHNHGNIGTDPQQTKLLNRYTTIYDRRNGTETSNEKVLYTRTNGNTQSLNGEERETTTCNYDIDQDNVRGSLENATDEPHMDFLKAELHMDNDSDSANSSFRNSLEYSSSNRDTISETFIDSGIDTDSQGSETNRKEINRPEIDVHEHGQEYRQSGKGSELNRIIEETVDEQGHDKTRLQSIKMTSNARINAKLQRDEIDTYGEKNAEEYALSNETVDDTRPKTIYVNVDVKIQQGESNDLQQNEVSDGELHDDTATKEKGVWPGNIPHQEEKQEKESCEILDADNTAPKETLFPSSNECLRNCSNIREAELQCSEKHGVECILTGVPNENVLLQENGFESNESEWEVVSESDVIGTASTNSENTEDVEQNNETKYGESEGQDAASYPKRL
ncbi:protein starmaker-like [Mercenaria mercenaria]|uniref:protein starmaker-like n=1 Tax=Mercenaria mercenaria TaxID=6596 RepID=UPI00234F4C27|nr:protein starmaker-like [Mercenaria mercenaria]